MTTIQVKKTVKTMNTFAKEVARQIVEQNPEHDFEWSCSELLTAEEWAAVLAQAMQLNDFATLFAAWYDAREDRGTDSFQQHGAHWFLQEWIDEHTESFANAR